jgi:phospholipid/cholesterol/gamma-HCH transport system permease protein
MLTGPTWIETLGKRALHSPAGLRARLRFANAAVTAALHVRPPIGEFVWRYGVRQLPIIALLGAVLGLLVVGQAVALLRQVGAQHFVGTVMVTVVMRELGPLLTAFVLAARAGTATVVELSLAGERKMRELVAPRLKAFIVATVCLTIYLIFIALAIGYLVAFLQGVPLRLAAYCEELADAMHWMDFVLVGVKAALFGTAVAVVSCFHGFEQRRQLEELPQATTRAVVESFACCLALDAVFLAGYLVR